MQRLCDPASEDCRAPLLALIKQETKGLDCAWWFMEDSRYATEIIKRHRAGVPIRILIDSRANSTYKLNASMLQLIKDAGIPMREKTAGGILHWKMMLFDGQNTVEFGSANFSPHAFRPNVPNMDYVDETVFFTDKSEIVNSFRRCFDDLWTETSGYANYANVTALARRYPLHEVSKDLNFVPWENFATRTASAINAETAGVDAIQYRITDRRQVDALLAARKRGLRVRLITEPKTYRSKYPEHAEMVDRLFVAGVEIKHRAHLGLNHQKSTILHAQKMAIFGSSNWSPASASSQAEHNYFAREEWVYEWFKAQFERKWNSASENVAFVPEGPGRPTLISPAHVSKDSSLTTSLKWEGGEYAQSYDLYLGTMSNPPLFRAGLSAESLKLPELEPGTTYFWKVVSKTAAGKSAASAVQKFTTEGAEEQ